MYRLRSSAFAVAAAVAWCGVLLQLWLSIQLGIANGAGVAAGLFAYLGYFTVLTNLLVAIVATRAARGRFFGSHGEAMWLGVATASITMVGLVYHLLLRNVWDPQGLQWVADMLLHYATPLARLGCWIVLGPGRRLPPRAPLAWCLYIGGYLAYALLRGAWSGHYPYYFIDAVQLGYARVAGNAVALLVLFAALAYAVMVMGNLRARNSR